MMVHDRDEEQPTGSEGDLCGKRCRSDNADAGNAFQSWRDAAGAMLLLEPSSSRICYSSDVT